ncbi:MAG: ester cyclase [Acidobacteriota bacterium]
MPEYPTLLHRWFDEVWNQKREEAIDEMMTEDVVIHGLGDEPIVGRENFKPFFRSFVSAFPDIHVTVEDAVSEGDKMSCRCIVRGTHTGDGLGFPPTNMPVEFTGGGLCTLTDGRFSEVWNEFDFLRMNTQMGTVTLNK